MKIAKEKTKALPYEVESALRTLGANLRTARLRRNLTIADVAERIGVHRHVVAAAESGKPTTGIAVYAGILWVVGLAGQLSQVADPLADEEGVLLARGMERQVARASQNLLDNNF